MDTQTVPPNKVVPLLAELNRLEDNVSSLAARLDPIVNHVPSAAGDLAKAEARTVTARIHTVGDALQYLLDNIEL